MQTKSKQSTLLGTLDRSLVRNPAHCLWFLLHLCIKCRTDTAAQSNQHERQVIVFVFDVQQEAFLEVQNTSPISIIDRSHISIVLASLAVIFKNAYFVVKCNLFYMFLIYFRP